MEYLDTFTKVLIGVFASAIGGSLIFSIRWLLSIKKNIGKMVDNGKKRASENRVQFKMIRSQGKAIRATLEVVSKVQNNGNVEKALEAMDEVDEEYDLYADGLVGFEEPEEIKK